MSELLKDLRDFRAKPSMTEEEMAGKIRFHHNWDDGEYFAVNLATEPIQQEKPSTKEGAKRGRKPKTEQPIGEQLSITPTSSES